MNLTTEYQERFARIAFEKLSKMPLRDENFLCLVFRCTKETLGLWKSEHPALCDAIELGLMSGEYKFRELLFSLSLVSSRRVNTKLLTTLASNVYNINDEQVQQVKSLMHDGNIATLEEKLEDLGIPIPVLPTEDLRTE